MESFKRAGRDPTEVDMVELHCTGELDGHKCACFLWSLAGTSVGDPIECNSAGELFKRDGEVIVTSLKGTFG